MQLQEIKLPKEILRMLSGFSLGPPYIFFDVLYHLIQNWCLSSQRVVLDAPLTAGVKGVRMHLVERTVSVPKLS